ncbi:MAG: acyl-ACP--UDP-N-acetylglucosamine O-acyltransferase [Lentisphaerae bacterium]|nr:acyl-ACP--UDP-N-acetylglucosamine O-acyltransferase [Lentisphaerota bacterium]
MSIHKTAIISDSAKLGTGITIGPYVVIEDNVEIGDNVKIGPSAVILPFTAIGKGTSIHAHAVIGDIPQDGAFKNIVSRTKIGENCIIREGVTIHRGTNEESVTEIGDGCFLMNNSHCAHNVKLGNNVILANGALLAGYVEVGDRAFISGNSVVHQFVRIGKVAMLSGLTAISQDVPPFCTTKGVHPNTILGLNVVGMRRAGLDLEERTMVKRCFNILYRQGLNTPDAVVKMKEETSGESAAEFASFVEQTKRGVCCLGLNADRHKE